MEKRFNTAGPCNPSKHYMVNIDNKLKVIEDMIARGDYFVINRPRQYGKTTLLSQLSKRLISDYIVVRISFEGIGDNIFQSEELFSSRILSLMARAVKNNFSNESHKLAELSAKVKDIDMLSEGLSEFMKDTEKPVILLIDEVDKSSNNQLFLSFLGMLRNKYIMANDGLDYTFKSVVLAGVHDVKNLKFKIRAEEEKKYNSPWNIAVNFNVDMSFSAEEIKTMLVDYRDENKVTMDTLKISEKIYFYTSGYPFLVSRLCQIISEELSHNKAVWNLDDIDKAVKLIINENNTLFESLIKNMENNKELYDLVYNIVINGDLVSYNILNPLINLGSVYGIFKNNNNVVYLNNKIYEQIVYNYLISKIETTKENRIMTQYNFKNNFITKDNGLDIEKILMKYQQFMKEQYSSKDKEFIEREGRLLFLAFIKPIINGVGFDFKEVQISEEKRLDVVITYNNYKYIIELKIWHGEEYHKRGIEQLSDYLDIQGLSKGYLVIYDFNKNKEYKNASTRFEDKDIFAVWL